MHTDRQTGPGSVVEVSKRNRQHITEIIESWIINATTFTFTKPSFLSRYGEFLLSSHLENNTIIGTEHVGKIIALYFDKTDEKILKSILLYLASKLKKNLLVLDYRAIVVSNNKDQVTLSKMCSTCGLSFCLSCEVQITRFPKKFSRFFQHIAIEDCIIYVPHMPGDEEEENILNQIISSFSLNNIFIRYDEDRFPDLDEEEDDEELLSQININHPVIKELLRINNVCPPTELTYHTHVKKSDVMITSSSEIEVDDQDQTLLTLTSLQKKEEDLIFQRNVFRIFSHFVSKSNSISRHRLSCINHPLLGKKDLSSSEIENICAMVIYFSKLKGLRNRCFRRSFDLHVEKQKNSENEEKDGESLEKTFTKYEQLVYDDAFHPSSSTRGTKDKKLSSTASGGNSIFNWESISGTPKLALERMVLWPVKYPEFFQKDSLLTQTNKGILLYGPPGSGKTFWAKSLAKECKVPFLHVKPSTLLNKYVGETEHLINGLFSLATKLKSCVIFLDEIDSLLGARTSDESSHNRHMKNQFMLNWDGFQNGGQVILIGATNRPFDIDDAVIDRFSRRIFVDFPNKSKRAEMIKNMLQNENLDSEIDFELLSEKTENFSGRDLRNMCMEAAYQMIGDNVSAVPGGDGDMTSSRGKKKRKLHITTRHLITAISQIIPGVSKDSESVEELRRWSTRDSPNGNNGSKILSYYS